MCEINQKELWSFHQTQSRIQIDQIIYREMQTRGQVDHREQRLRVSIARQEITGADRQWAE
jgi:hypothetical protein